MSRVFFRAMAALGISLVLSACLTDKVSEQGTEVDVVEAPDPDTYVCDPFTNSVGGHRFQGVHGALSYMDPSGPRYRAVADYIAYGTKVDVDLFFNHLYVPTRPFDRGFVTQAGNAIKAADGSDLYEWFSIRFSGQLVVDAQHPPGPYQMAILSDDGSVLRVNDPSSGVREIINNDGDHPTRLGCASEPVHLSANVTLPFELDYYQGPRYHIALVLLWRPWPTHPSDVLDPLCNRSGNSMWFDFRQDPPVPTANFNALLSRGWQVVNPENLILPKAANENPCNAPAPILSQVNVVDVATTTARVTWVTDLPASSQVEVTLVATGTKTLTPHSTALVTSHDVRISGLSPNTLYQIKAISASSSGLSSESSSISFRTRR